jgi:predicted kinase
MPPKEKIVDKQFLLIVNGPSCGGKTTVAKAILERYGSIFDASMDNIKWHISDYAPERHRPTVQDMTHELMHIALKHGLSVLKQGASWKPEDIIAIADEHKVPWVLVNVSAPWDVLAQRFEGRIEEKIKGGRISNVSHERFKELYDMYQETKMETPLEFDSSKQSPEEMVEAIVTYVRAKLG